MATTNQLPREYDEPKDAHYSSVLDAFADVFMSPEAAAPWRPAFGFMARVRDGQRISKDFRKAVKELDLDTE